MTCNLNDGNARRVNTIACQLHVYFKAVKLSDWSMCKRDMLSRFNERYPEMRLVFDYEELNKHGLNVLTSTKRGGFPELNIDMLRSDKSYESDGEDEISYKNYHYNLTHCQDYLNELSNFDLNCVNNCSWPVFPTQYVYILNFAFGFNYPVPSSTSSSFSEPVYFIWSNNINLPVNFKWVHYYEACNDSSLHLPIDRYDRRRFYNFILKRFDYIKNINYNTDDGEYDDDDGHSNTDDDCIEDDDIEDEYNIDDNTEDEYNVDYSIDNMENEVLV